MPDHLSALDMAGNPIPENPTVAQIAEALSWSYTQTGVAIWLRGAKRSFGGRRPIDMLDTEEGRREVYGEALALAEGTFT